MKTLTICFIVFISFIVSSQTDDNKYSINDVSWMAGKWKVELFGSEGIEYYSKPANGAMVGCFILPGDKNVFEFYIISEEENGVYYRFKHYWGNMEPWENEPLTYKLIEATNYKAVFKSKIEYKNKPHKIVYVRKDENEIRVNVIGKDDGNEDKFEVIYKKVID